MVTKDNFTKANMIDGHRFFSFNMIWPNMEICSYPSFSAKTKSHICWDWVSKKLFQKYHGKYISDLYLVSLIWSDPIWKYVHILVSQQKQNLTFAGIGSARSFFKNTMGNILVKQPHILVFLILCDLNQYGLLSQF